MTTVEKQEHQVSMLNCSHPGPGSPGVLRSSWGLVCSLSDARFIPSSSSSVYPDFLCDCQNQVITNGLIPICKVKRARMLGILCLFMTTNMKREKKTIAGLLDHRHLLRSQRSRQHCTHGYTVRENSGRRGESESREGKFWPLQCFSSFFLIFIYNSSAHMCKMLCFYSLWRTGTHTRHILIPFSILPFPPSLSSIQLLMLFCLFKIYFLCGTGTWTYPMMVASHSGFLYQYFQI